MSRGVVWVRSIAAALAVVGVVLSAAACTRTSETTEMSDDAADVTIPGAPPTAPPTTEYDGRGLSSDANKLLADLTAIESETDLCAILTGDSFTPFLEGKIDTTNLVTSPSGLTQLLVAVNSIFAHVVDISPPEIQPSTAVLQDVWTRVASISSAAPDYEAQVNAIGAEPEVAAAYQALGTWVATNCGSSILLPSA